MFGPSSKDKQLARGLAQQQKQISQKLFQQEQQLFGLGGQIISPALSFIEALASGDTQRMRQALAPALQGYETQMGQVLSQILNRGPRSGAQMLATEQARQQLVGSAGDLLTEAYTSAFPMLTRAGMAGLNIAPQLSFASSQAASVGGQALEQQLQAEAMGAEAKAQTLSHIAMSAGYLGGMAMG
jgi:hypothetical protein